MSTVARIEELRKKVDENPRRYFAPLANELRKAGELTQAIALCREHLPKQPGHMSGHIVFGQALFEIGALDEARGVFEQALALDPENCIALHHLGHTARQQGDTAAADPERELAFLDLDEPVGADATSFGTMALTVAVVSTTGDLSDDMPAQALGDDPFGFADDESGSAPSVDAAATAPIDLDVAFEEGLVTAGWPAHRDLEAVSAPRAVTPLSFKVTPDAVEAFGREADDPVVPLHSKPELDVLSDDADLTPLTPGTPGPVIVESEALTPDDGPADVASEPVAQAAAFVTETMGELLVAQGFTHRAVVVYEELVRRRPDDPMLSARLAELRRQLETDTAVPVHMARERFAALAARRVVRRATVRPYTPITPDDSRSLLFGAESRAQADFAAQTLANAISSLPSEAAPEAPAAGGASAGDDFAQFSAWLKGLGQP
ncbi:hypothetical protein [Gemmatimonas sp.]|uniref:hypothetical protein n=1 Tax=Gemmatimonas sp. TaxID=1962908 RepID=UPI0027B8900E|nr:hypothetical protein [Gemmatimonas sp.]